MQSLLSTSYSYNQSDRRKSSSETKRIRSPSISRDDKETTGKGLNQLNFYLSMHLQKFIFIILGKL